MGENIAIALRNLGGIHADMIPSTSSASGVAQLQKYLNSYLPGLVNLATLWKFSFMEKNTLKTKSNPAKEGEGQDQEFFINKRCQTPTMLSS